MDRRDTVLALLALGAAPLAAEAQQAAKVARIGYLSSSLASSPRLRDAFLQGLRELGYVEGRNVVIEYRDAEGKPERFPPRNWSASVWNNSSRSLPGLVGSLSSGISRVEPTDARKRTC